MNFFEFDANFLFVQVPDKRGVSAAQSEEAVNSKRKKKFLGRTTYADGYVDPKAAALAKRGEPEWLLMPASTERHGECQRLQAVVPKP